MFGDRVRLILENWRQYPLPSTHTPDVARLICTAIYEWTWIDSRTTTNRTLLHATRVIKLGGVSLYRVWLWNAPTYPRPCDCRFKRMIRFDSIIRKWNSKIQTTLYTVSIHSSNGLKETIQWKYPQFDISRHRLIAISFITDIEGLLNILSVSLEAFIE